MQKIDGAQKIVQDHDQLLLVELEPVAAEQGLSQVEIDNFHDENNTAHLVILSLKVWNNNIEEARREVVLRILGQFAQDLNFTDELPGAVYPLREAMHKLDGDVMSRLDVNCSHDFTVGADAELFHDFVIVLDVLEILADHSVVA